MSVVRKRVAVGTMVSGVLLLGGCGGGDSAGGPASPSATASVSEDPQATEMTEVAEAARAYAEVYLLDDYQARCEAETERLRGGTVADCVAQREENDPGAEGAEILEVRLSELVEPMEIPASGMQLAGWGVLVEYDYAFDGQETETSMEVIRVVRETPDGPWLIDQNEDFGEDYMEGLPPDFAVSERLRTG